jgi:hypothetical protein
MSVFSFPEQVNERAARLVAATVASTLGVAYAAQTSWWVGVLAVGFVLRVGWGPKLSPLARAAVAVSGALWPVRPVPGKPKRFAQGIGAVCTLGATALFASGHTGAGWALAALVALFATLEATVAFCMGCWIYARLQGLGVLPPDACAVCAPGDA